MGNVSLGTLGLAAGVIGGMGVAVVASKNGAGERWKPTLVGVAGGLAAAACGALLLGPVGAAPGGAVAAVFWGAKLTPDQP